MEFEKMALHLILSAYLALSFKSLGNDSLFKFESNFLLPLDILIGWTNGKLNWHISYGNVKRTEKNVIHLENISKKPLLIEKNYTLTCQLRY